MGPRIARLVRFVGWFGGMTAAGIAVALALGRVDTGPDGRTSLAPPLRLVAAGLAAAGDGAGRVALAPVATFEPDRQAKLWTLTGAATIRTADGRLVMRRYRASFRNLCDAYDAPRCWRLESLSPGEGRRRAATSAPSERLHGGARVLAVQRRLKILGFDPGPLDGRMGPRTRKAIRSYEDRHGLPAKGWPRAELLDHLEVNVLFARGLDAFEAGDLHRAARHYVRVVELVPDESAAHFNRGLVYRRLAFHDLAIRDYDAALRLDPGNTRALFDRANAHAAQRRYGAAAMDYAESLSYWLFGGSAFEHLGQEFGAVSDSLAKSVAK